MIATETEEHDRRSTRGYELLFELGRGGMGMAYLARGAGTQGFGRLVVIKRLLPERLGDADAVARFLREARIAAAIHHANVAGTQQVGKDDRGPFIVIDYIDGANFSELAAECTMAGVEVPARIALRVALDALAGLEAVHGACDVHGVPLKILHRDVSLENILVGRDGVARLSDFGLAKSEFPDRAPSQPRYLVGKLPYISPEYLRGKTLGPASDVYAVGVALWLALAGGDPWPEAHDAETMRRIVEEGMPPLQPRPGLSLEAANIVMTACATRLADRFGTARDMSDAIEMLDQEHHCLATHREVGAWVEQVMGKELERRRERIARLLDRHKALPTTVPSVHAEPMLPSRVQPTPQPWQVVLQHRLELKTGVWVVLAAIALVIALQLGRSFHLIEPALGDSPPQTAPSAAVAGAAQPGPIVVVGDVAPPPPPASSVATSVKVVSASRPATPRRAPSAAPPASSPVRAPDGIQRTNPYR